MIAMGFALLPPQPSMLRYAHLEDIVKKYPQQGRFSKNYAIAGGAAAMLLLEAAKAQLLKLRCELNP